MKCLLFRERVKEQENSFFKDETIFFKSTASRNSELADLECLDLC